MTGFFDIDETDRKVGGFIWKLISKPDEPSDTEVMEKFTEEELRTLTPEELGLQWKIRANKLRNQKKSKRERQESSERTERELERIRRFEEERLRLELQRDMDRMALASALDKRNQDVKEKGIEDSKPERSLPTCTINDDKVRNILEPSEQAVAHVIYDGRLFGGEYDRLVITSRRLIFYKKGGHFGQKIKCASVSLNEVGFPSLEEKGTISKKAVLKIDIGMEEPLEWVGNRSEMEGLYRDILAVKA